MCRTLMILRVDISFKVRRRFPIWVEIDFIDVDIEGHNLRDEIEKRKERKKHVLDRGISIGTVRFLCAVESALQVPKLHITPRGRQESLASSCVELNRRTPWGEHS